jgi:undecaprenyl-diphosphatase
MPPPATPPTETNDARPPLLPSWRAWYALVLGALAAEIALMVALTRYFAA